MKWFAKKVKQLFKLEIKNPHPPCVICEGTCVCNETYTGGSRRNALVK